MATKHRRLSPKPKPAASKRTCARRPVPKVKAKAAAAKPGRTRPVGIQGPPPPARDERGDMHERAVRAYERGVDALQRREFRQAEALLASVIEQFPDEKELHERVRLYLNVCRRQAAPPDRTPRTVDERVYAATLAINAGVYDKAQAELHAALQTDAENGNVRYMLAVVHALRGDLAASAAHLQRSIEINPENRFLALHDEDLAALRQTDQDFRSIVDSALTARRERRARPAR